MNQKKIVTIIVLIFLISSILTGCIAKSDPTTKTTSVSDAPVESYVAVAPRTMQAGENVAITFTLLSKKGQLTADFVQVALFKDNTQISNSVASGSNHVAGKGQVDLLIPSHIPEGDYQLRIQGSDFEDETTVRVEKKQLVLLETDKPIYKPGQTIHIRVMTLNSSLRPLNESVTIEALDAKGIKIFRKEVDTDEYGMVTLDLPLSTEPNLGVWKINASIDESKTQLDVRVEKYVLPKYEVGVDLPKNWYLIDEPIEGEITAEYSFGKPVKGELEIKASRYVGKWEQYATFITEIDGSAEFDIPAVRYVTGVPAARGMGNVVLDITVRERSTGYEEKTSRMFTVSESPLNVQIIPEGTTFKPSLPFSFLIVTETPDNRPTDAKVQLTITHINEKFNRFKTDQMNINTRKGKGIITITPTKESVALEITATADGARASKTLESSYSPSGNFIHVEQVSEGIAGIGDDLIFKIHSTREAANFYYEIISRDQVVFTDFTQSDEISFTAIPQMAPSPKLLVYQILPNSEVAADYIPFSVDAVYPHKVTAEFSTAEARPGDQVGIEVTTEGEARVGLVAVDKSVFILAENRLNLQQVFDELERLYMQPQVELHEVNIYSGVTARGAQEIFQDAGVVVLSNQNIPEGKDYDNPMVVERVVKEAGAVMLEREVMMAVPVAKAVQDTSAQSSADGGGGLAEVERVRQFFPETWLWQDIMTDSNGKATLDVEVPDTITTWMLRAVALSKEKGLGIDEAQLIAFQPFFLSIDLPYSSIRGEEFPVSVAVYNYLDEPQNVLVEIDQGDWFDLLDKTAKSVEVAANDIGGVEFKISPKKLGINKIKITARSKEAADAAVKTVIVEPEGVSREIVQNLTLSGGTSKSVDTGIPALVVEDSGRAFVAVTSSFLTQTMEGLEGLLQMPFGCGEQNMLLFAPDVFITKYLKNSNQLKPEIMAKAEKLMITGYQRELTYMRRDGSFSAFGESDQSGSLWLTAFVLKSFSQAKDLIYIDENVLSQAKNWIVSHQKSDGSFESVGFVHHQEMIGGLQGKNGLTAYVATALLEASETSAATRAIRYLEGQLDQIDDEYTLAITAYALELAGSDQKDRAIEKLIAMAQEDENGLFWGSEIQIQPLQEMGIRAPKMAPHMAPQIPVIETTAYATLALNLHGDIFNASRAAQWLVSRRNALGGYGSTQDTVVALQALMEHATGARADVDLRVIIIASGLDKEIQITQENFDVLQIIEVPVNEQITINAAGKGKVLAQVVTRFNLPEAVDVTDPILEVDVDYDATEVEVNDLLKVSATIKFNPPRVEMEAGMVVLDISVPTGFVAVADSVAGVVENQEKIKRYEVAGRKVIFYIENMLAGESLSFSFDVQAMYPVKAKGVSSQVYAYYQPDIKGETLGQAIVVR